MSTVNSANANNWPTYPFSSSGGNFSALNYTRYMGDVDEPLNYKHINWYEYRRMSDEAKGLLLSFMWQYTDIFYSLVRDETNIIFRLKKLPNIRGSQVDQRIIWGIKRKEYDSRLDYLLVDPWQIISVLAVIKAYGLDKRFGRLLAFMIGGDDEFHTMRSDFMCLFYDERHQWAVISIEIGECVACQCLLHSCQRGVPFAQGPYSRNDVVFIGGSKSVLNRIKRVIDEPPHGRGRRAKRHKSHWNRSSYHSYPRCYNPRLRDLFLKECRSIIEAYDKLLETPSGPPKTKGREKRGRFFKRGLRIKK